MLYHNIRHNDRKVTLKEAVLTGVGADQGLYMPDFIPQLPRAVFNNLSGMSLTEVGYIVAGTLFDKVIPLETINAIVRECLTYPMPLRQVENDRYVLELFHGPTKTVKDTGARFMSRVLNHFARTVDRVSGKINVLVATSGDTGNAVANEFSSLPDVNVFLLYPQGLISTGRTAPFRKNDKVIPIAVRGSFDDCRRMVREALNNAELNRQMHLTSANSINIARLLPQAIYFFQAYARLTAETDVKGRGVAISVPGGNLGTLTAGVIARRMGLPVRLISAHNANDTFARYLQGEPFEPADEPIATTSPAIDVNNPENYPRLLDLYGRSATSMRTDIEGVSYSDAQVAETIDRIKRDQNYLLDPHSAVAYSALERLRPGEIGIALATAAPAENQESRKEPVAESPRRIARTLSALRNVLMEHNR